MLEDSIRHWVLERGFLYRGTNSVAYDERRISGNSYFGVGGRLGKVTFCSLDFEVAAINAVGRCKKLYYQERDAKPLLLAVRNIEKYIDNIRKGLEWDMFLELEIVGDIDFQDIEVIDTVEKLRKLDPKLSLSRLRRFLKQFPVLNSISSDKIEK